MTQTEPKKYRITGTKDGKPVSAVVASRTMQGACGHAERAGITVSGAVEIRDDEQRRAVVDVTLDLTMPGAEAAGAALAAGAGLAGMFTGCCGGMIPIIIGLLLARKETVLMCSACRAVVAMG